MPTYEYRCNKCHHVFEAFQGIKEKPLTKCPKCKGRVQRQIGTGAGIIFKGSGFYQTDYKCPPSKPSPEKKSSESKSETKSDSGKTGSKTSKD